ncbi:hypothetical protein HZA99_04810 [Candidatus Woesearchaeota archaeon]|nr:hypothetical protein [Candidatus Woesearchaeota archaeon]
MNYFLTWALILVLGTIILYFIMKNVLRVVVTFLFIVFLFVAMTLTLTYSDVQSLREDIQDKEIVLIVHDQGNYLFGLVQYTENEEKKVKEISLSEDDLAAAVADEHYKTILQSGSYYKVILLDKSVFAVLPSEITAGNETQATNDLFAILSDTNNSFDERAIAFSTLLSALSEQEGMFYVLSEFQNGNVVIYPKTMFFRVLESLPLSWVDKLIPNGFVSG